MRKSGKKVVTIAVIIYLRWFSVSRSGTRKYALLDQSADWWNMECLSNHSQARERLRRRSDLVDPEKSVSGGRKDQR